MKIACVGVLSIIITFNLLIWDLTPFSVADTNPDLELRFSGTLQCRTVYHSARPEPRIRIRQLSV